MYNFSFQIGCAGIHTLESFKLEFTKHEPYSFYSRGVQKRRFIVLFIATMTGVCTLSHDLLF